MHDHRNWLAGCLTLAALIAAPAVAAPDARKPAAARPAAAGEITWLKGTLGSMDVSFRGTNDWADALQRAMDSYDKLPPKFTGPATPDGPATLEGIFYERKTKRAVQFKLEIPAAVWARLDAGNYPMGDLSSIGDRSEDQQGWHSDCPDHVQGRPILQFTEYGPMDDEPNPMLRLTGPKLRYYQTQTTRVHQDSAVLRVTKVDRAANRIEAELEGTATNVEPKDPPEVNNRKPTLWMCNPGEYKIETTRFNLKFLVDVHRW
jgi:hypothetical protein